MSFKQCLLQDALHLKCNAAPFIKAVCFDHCVCWCFFFSAYQPTQRAEK